MTQKFTVDYLAPSSFNEVDQYAPPPNYGIPNPYGPRTHNWKGGPLDEGSLYHGPIYTRPSYNLPVISNPLFGTPTTASENAKMIFFGVGFLVLAAVALAITPKRTRGL